MSGESTEDWARREALLDELLPLTPAESQTRLSLLQQSHLGDAEALLGWLSGIEDSDNHWLQTRATVPQNHEGAVVGHWRALRLLGQGGMGEVWLGERDDGLFNKQVAIKFIREDCPALVQGIESERRMLAGLQHPGIVRLLDAGSTADGRPWLVTDYIDGTRLDQWLRAQAPDVATRLALFVQIAEAVAYAHGQLVVHRDIKPANVLVDDAGRAHLLDFGIARPLNTAHQEAAQPTAGMLTPEYAAPELITGETANVGSDVYALGALLNYMLCGEPPIALQGLTLAELVQQVRTQAPAPLLPRIPAALAATARKPFLQDIDSIVAKALSKAPAQRYASVEAMLRDIRAAEQHLPLQARPAGRMERLRRALRRNRAAVAVAAVVLSAVLVGLVGTLWQAQRANQQRDIAEAQATTAKALRDFMVGVFESANPEQAQGDPPSARELVDAAARRIRNDLAATPALQAELFLALGDTYIGLGHYPQAVQLLDEALRGTDANAPVYRRLLASHARALQFQGGPYEGVVERIEHALANTSGDDDDDPDAKASEARLRASLGGMLQKTGQLDRAAIELERALTDARAAGTTGEPALLAALQQQVQLDYARGHREQAIARLRTIIGILDRQPLLATANRQQSMQELANLLGEAGHGDEAEVILQQVVQASEATYGVRHPATLSANVLLARARERLGRSDEARVLLERTLAQALQDHGEDSEASLLARANLAALEYNTGHHAQAIALMQQVRAHIIARDGALSPRALLTLQNLARIRMSAGELGLAERDLEELLVGLRAINSDATGEPLSLLGTLARQRGDAARAATLHRQALAAHAAAGDSGSFDVWDLHLELGEDERDLGNLATARSEVQIALDGLMRLDDEANARMIAYAHYLLAQLDVLEQRCDADGLHTMRALRDAQPEAFDAPALPPDTAWRIARIDLYIGLCRGQINPRDTDAKRLTHAAARFIANTSLADPHTRKLARDSLR